MDSGSSPSRVLRDEHRLILEVVTALDAELARTDEPIEPELMDDCVSFFRLFADACHHGKEEDMLFPALEREGMPHETGPIAVMLYEHSIGRSHVARMREALDGAKDHDAEATAAFRAAAMDYSALIRAHIGKEDTILFNMADGMIVGPACAELCAGYDATCARSYEGKTKDDLQQLAARITRTTE